MSEVWLTAFYSPTLGPLGKTEVDCGGWGAWCLAAIVLHGVGLERKEPREVDGGKEAGVKHLHDPSLRLV